MHAALQKEVEKTPIFNPIFLLFFSSHNTHTHTHPTYITHTTHTFIPHKLYSQFISELLFLRKQGIGRGNHVFPLVVQGCQAQKQGHTRESGYE